MVQTQVRRPDKAGILLAAFGSSNPGAQMALKGFAERVRSGFPGLPVRWAFTSGIIRTRLAGEGKKTDSVNKALGRMWFEGFSHLAVQSLHVVPGAEYSDLLSQVEKAACDPATGQSRSGGEMCFTRALVGAPLLDGEDDVRRAARAILSHLPEGRREGEPVVLMGHGTWHGGDSRYEDLSRELAALDRRVHIATMEGSRTIHDVLPDLGGAVGGRVHLMPLLAVAGEHVVRDMAGDRPDSWKSILTQAGFKCSVVSKGAAEYERLADIWIDHLAAVVEQVLEGMGGRAE